MSQTAESMSAAASSSSSPPPPHPCSSHTLTLPDFTLHYTLHGSSSSPTRRVLLVMGLLTDGSAWQYQVDYFSARGYECLTYDHRGVGKSSTPGFIKMHTYTTSNMARDAIALANHVGWECFHLVGVSMGGMIALEMALAIAPQRLLSLTLVVTHAGGWGGIAPWAGVKSMITSIFTKDNKVRLQALLRMLYSEESLKDEELQKKLTQHHIERMKKRVAPKLAAVFGHPLAVYRHYVSYPNLLRIRFAPFPTLVIVGEEDKLVQMSNSYMLANVLGSHLVVVPNGGHGLLSEYPETINKEMEQFFERTEGARERGEKIDKEGDLQVDEEGNVSDTANAAERAGDFELESSATLRESASESPEPYSLEQQALTLVCSHTVHCSAHNIAGFVTGFVPAFIFRWIFFDSISMNSSSSPISRWDQSVRFGLLIGIIRGGWRAIKCIMHAYRARQWVLKHKLAEKQTKETEASSSSVPSRRSKIPHGVGFEFPTHSFILLAVCIFVFWKKQLITMS